MTVILILFSLLAIVFGILSMSQATMGAAIVGVGCFLGILARISQAYEHHAELVKLLTPPPK
jgi:succinate-acetate transporter protein